MPGIGDMVKFFSGNKGLFEHITAYMEMWTKFMNDTRRHILAVEAKLQTLEDVIRGNQHYVGILGIREALDNAAIIAERMDVNVKFLVDAATENTVTPEIHDRVLSWADYDPRQKEVTDGRRTETVN